MKRKKRLRLIREMRREHVRAQHKHKATVSKMRSSLASGMGGLSVGKMSKKRFNHKKELRKLGVKNTFVSVGWAKRSVEYRANCKHKRKRRVNKHWKQCRDCALCIPKLGKKPKILRLPPILKDVVLPPRFENDQRADLRGVHSLSGIALSKYVRLEVLQSTWQTEPLIDRFSVQLRFPKKILKQLKRYYKKKSNFSNPKDFKMSDDMRAGWLACAVIYETHWYKILPIIQAANPKKPKKLFYQIQRKLGTHWPEPWLPPIWRRGDGVYKAYWDKKLIMVVRNGQVSYRRKNKENAS